MTTECSMCLYDESIPKITFDRNGVCSYCHQHRELDNKYASGYPELLQRIKKDGQGKPYDVVVGVSGGCDSSYMLHQAVEDGLRPIACHYDNTFNEPIGEENLRKLLKKLNVPLDTYTVDKREAVDLMRAFMLAGVPDIDTPSDIALAAAHYMTARKYGVKWIFEGHNFRTEGISPIGFFYMDAKYIQTVHREYGTVPMKTLPMLWLSKWLWWTIVNGIKKVRPHYYRPYDKEAVKMFLANHYGWQWYGGHHHENRTSYFTNRFWLYWKFGIDIRKVEYSAHIRSGTMTKDEAKTRLMDPPTCDHVIMDEFSGLMGVYVEDILESVPNRTFRDYKTYKQTFEHMKPLFSMMLKAKMINEGFYTKYAGA